jgi:membrane dipeptidase
LDHFDYLVDLVGVDHVGIGSDYDGMRQPPVGLEDVSKMPNVTRGLVSRGYSEDEIVKILGGNFLRVFRDVID